ncbi:hypothetical protein MCW82_01040 [Azospirillum doebereinerae]|uniref:hypothetical protein n=1 Tax=Azospirillum doebereinerae TaxID=92933 RepID=UPI001EE55A3F|nr:hypothetical protein [Azospirillum doebereinerae]MCG5238368.1 hypothetical protein [Azospirillum doebereinerae]
MAALTGAGGGGADAIGHIADAVGVLAGSIAGIVIGGDLIDLARDWLAVGAATDANTQALAAYNAEQETALDRMTSVASRFALLQGARAGLSSLGEVAPAIAGTTTAMSGLLLMATRVHVAIAALSAAATFGSDSMAAAEKAEAALQGLDLALTRSGSAAGLTRDQMLTLAYAVEKATGQTRDEVLELERQLTGFRRIPGALFGDIIEGAGLVARTMKIDMADAFKALASAIDDPATAQERLTAVSVHLTSAQADLIAKLAQVGDRGAAQRAVLEQTKAALTAQAGQTVAVGTAMDDSEKSAKRLAASFRDLQEAAGQGILAAGRYLGLLKDQAASFIPDLPFDDWMANFNENVVAALGTLPLETQLGRVQEQLKKARAELTGLSADYEKTGGVMMLQMVQDAENRIATLEQRERKVSQQLRDRPAAPQERADAGRLSAENDEHARQLKTLSQSAQVTADALLPPDLTTRVKGVNSELDKTLRTLNNLRNSDGSNAAQVDAEIKRAQRIAQAQIGNLITDPGGDTRGERLAKLKEQVTQAKAGLQQLRDAGTLSADAYKEQSAAIDKAAASLSSSVSGGRDQVALTDQQAQGQLRLAQAYMDGKGAALQAQAAVQAATEAARDGATSEGALSQALLERAAAEALVAGAKDIDSLRTRVGVLKEMAAAAGVSAAAEAEAEREIKARAFADEKLTAARLSGSRDAIALAEEEALAYSKLSKEEAAATRARQEANAVRADRRGIDTLETQLRLVGATREERTKELALLKLRQDLEDRYADTAERAAQYAARRGDVERRALLEGQLQDAEQAAQDQQRIWSTAAEGIQSSLSDAFKGAFDKSASQGKSFASNLRSLLLSTAAQIAAAFVFRPVIGGVLNAVGLSGIANQIAPGSGSMQTAGGSLASSGASQMVQVGQNLYSGWTGGSGATLASAGTYFAESALGHSVGLSTAYPMMTSVPVGAGAGGTLVAGEATQVGTAYAANQSGAALSSGLGAIGAAAPYGMLGGMAGAYISNNYMGGSKIGGGAVGALAGVGTYAAGTAAMGAMGMGAAATAAGASGMAGATAALAAIPVYGWIAAAVIAAVMAVVGSKAPTVGPNGAGNIFLDANGAKSGPYAADNGMDDSGMKQVSDAAVTSINAVVSGIGAQWKVAGESAFAHFQMFAKDGKWSFSDEAGNNKQTFTSQDEFFAALLKTSVRRLDSEGKISGVSDDVRTALANTKATKAEDLANDLSFAAAFRKQFDLMNASMDPTNNQIKDFAEAAKALGEQVKTNITDWRSKASELGLATETQLTEAARKGITAMMGLGPAVQPLVGIAAATKQAEMQFESFRPALLSLGYTAADVADLATQYTRQFQTAYTDAVGLLQRQAAVQVAALSGTGSGLTAAEQFRVAGASRQTVEAAAFRALTVNLDAVTASARLGALTLGDVNASVAALNQALYNGVLTAEQYGTAVTMVTSAYQGSQQVLSTLRQGWAAISAITEPNHKQTATDVLNGAMVNGGGAGVGAFGAQLDALFASIRAGTASFGDLAYTYRQLVPLLQAGVITGDQFNTVVQSMTGAWQTGAASLDAVRRGRNSVEGLIDPTRPTDGATALADAGATGADALRRPLDDFFRAASAGTAKASDLRYVQERLADSLSAGTITASQYTTVLNSVTGAWTSGRRVATDAAAAYQNVYKQALQEQTTALSELQRTATAARDAWKSATDAVEQALSNLRQRSDLLPLNRLADATTTYEAALEAVLHPPADKAADPATVDALLASVQPYLEALKSVWGDDPEFFRKLEDVEGALRSTGVEARRQTTAADTQVRQLDQQISWLKTLADGGATTNTLLNEIKANLMTAANPTEDVITRAQALVSTENRVVAAAEGAAGRALTRTERAQIGAPYQEALASIVNTASSSDLGRIYEHAKGVSGLYADRVMTAEAARGVSFSWADKFKFQVFGAFWDEWNAAAEKGATQAEKDTIFNFYIARRDALFAQIPTADLLSLRGQGGYIEPTQPQIWEGRVTGLLHDRGVPGFARGGTPPVNSAFKMNEEGAELVQFGVPTRIYNANDTRGFVSNMGADIGPLLRALIEEGRATAAYAAALVQGVAEEGRRSWDALRELLTVTKRMDARAARSET